MKNQLKAFILAAGLAVSMTAQQTNETAKVPFAFNVQQKTFPAGDYRVSQLTPSGVFQIYDATGHSVFLNAPLQKDANPDKPHLGFACYGKECALSEIAMPGKSTTNGLSQTAVEKNFTRKLGMVSMIAIRLGSR